MVVDHFKRGFQKRKLLDKPVTVVKGESDSNGHQDNKNVGQVKYGTVTEPELIIATGHRSTTESRVGVDVVRHDVCIDIRRQEEKFL